MNRPEQDLIFDRTQADVDNDEPKGQYNASDLNRVESWCVYLATELNSVGYNIQITTKTDWVQTDDRTAEEMERIRNNIKKIMDGYYSLTQIEQNAENFDWRKANNWERILNEMNSFMLGMRNWYVYSGVSNAGQSRLWQNRFRHFFKQATGGDYLTTETGDTLITENNEELEIEIS